MRTNSDRTCPLDLRRLCKHVTNSHDTYIILPKYTLSISQFIMDDDDRNEARMLDTRGGLNKVLAFEEINSDVAKLCVLGSPACVTSFSGYTGISSSDPLRIEYAEALEDCGNGDTTGCNALLGIQVRMLARAFSSVRQASNHIESVDVTFNMQRLTPRPDANIAGPVLPGTVHFNTCLNNGVADPDDRSSSNAYFAYATAVHEAGHALGLSNVSYVGLVTDSLFSFFGSSQPYEAAHPTIPDSVMNYDAEVPDNWATWAPSPLNEPDCSPHPFDLMAIYTLYQAIPFVTISGPASQAELTSAHLRVDQVTNAAPPYTYEWTTSWPDLMFSPDNRSASVSLALPDVDAADPVWQRRLTVEVQVTDSNGKVGRARHEIEVRP